MGRRMASQLRPGLSNSCVIDVRVVAQSQPSYTPGRAAVSLSAHWLMIQLPSPERRASMQSECGFVSTTRDTTFPADGQWVQ